MPVPGPRATAERSAARGSNGFPRGRGSVPPGWVPASSEQRVDLPSDRPEERAGPEGCPIRGGVSLQRSQGCGLGLRQPWFLSSSAASAPGGSQSLSFFACQWGIMW